MKNSKILTVAGIVAMGVSPFLSAIGMRSTLKCEKITKKSVKEHVKKYWRRYVPSAVFTITGIALVALGDNSRKKTIAALSAGYAILAKNKYRVEQCAKRVVDDVQNNIGSSDNIQDNGVDVIEDISEVNEVTNNVMENNMFDFSNVSSNDNNDSVDSSDYFSSLGNSNSQVQNTSEVVSSVNSNDYFAQFNETNVVPATNQVVDNIGISNNQNNLNVEQTSNVGNQVDNINNQIDSVSNVVQNDLNVSTDNSFVDNVGVYNNQDSLNAQQVNNIQDVNDFTQLSSVVDNQSNGVQSVDDNYNFGVSSTAPNLENPSFIPNPDFADPFSLSNSLDGNQSSVNTSYIDEVKDRLSTGYDGPSNLNQSQFNNEIGTENLGFSPSNVTLGDSVISDRNDLPELEKISSVPIDENSIDKTDKKGRLGIIIFMIFLVLALGALSFYLYNYVF